MNDEQKTCLWLSIAVIALMAIFPPTPHGCYYRPLMGGFGPNKEERMKPLGYTFHCGYTFLFSAETSKAFDKLFVQWAVAALVTAGLIYTHKTKEDNKKQKICLLVGITIIVLMAIFPPVDKRIISGYSRRNSRGIVVPDYKTIKYAFFFTAKAEEIEYAQLLIQCSVVGAITAGLIYTLRDKKPKDEQNNKSL